MGPGMPITLYENPSPWPVSPGGILAPTLLQHVGNYAQAAAGEARADGLAAAAAVDGDLTTHTANVTDAHDLTARLAAKSDTGHNHAGVYDPAGSAATVATALTTHQSSGDHDGRYYTETEVDALIARITSLSGNGPWYPGVAQETYPAQLCVSAATLITGRVYLTYFTAVEALTVSKLMGATRTAAVGQTFARMGLYSVAGNGDITLVARIASDAALWTGSTFTGFIRSFDTAGGYPSSYQLTAGARYAVGQLSVFSGTGPGPMLNSLPFTGVVGPVGAAGFLPRRLVGSVDGQTDLPTSVVNASIGTAGGVTPWAAVGV